LLFIIYTYYLPPTIHTLSEPTIFAVGIKLIISSKGFDNFYEMSDIMLSCDEML
jgi:hypothetical protein